MNFSLCQYYLWNVYDDVTLASLTLDKYFGEIHEAKSSTPRYGTNHQ